MHFEFRFLIICTFSVILLSASSVYAQDAVDFFELNLLPVTEFPRAKCLDGSQGGYYISKRDPKVVILHFQGLLLLMVLNFEVNSNEITRLPGGGWCTQDPAITYEQTCADRANGINPFGEVASLGGSGNWVPQTVGSTLLFRTSGRFFE